MNAIMNPMLTIHHSAPNGGILDAETALNFATLMNAQSEDSNKAMFMPSKLYPSAGMGAFSPMINFNSMLQPPFLRPPMPLLGFPGSTFASTMQMQQLINQQQNQIGINENMPKVSPNAMASEPPKTMLRIKGMGPGSTVNDILHFLGTYWQLVAFHGIHLIYSTSVSYWLTVIVSFTSFQYSFNRYPKSSSV